MEHGQITGKIPIMHRPLVLVLLVLTTGCQTQQRIDAPAPAVVAVASMADPARRLSDAARRLLASVKSTSYSHHSIIDEDSGSFVTDCSGLMTWLLKQEMPEHLAAIPIKRGRSHPVAVDFQEAFVAGATGWQRIARVQDVRPGDVLAWRYLNPKPGKSTGHVMVIDSAAVPDGDSVFSVAVIDSTTAPHDDDTRSDTDGVGRGTIHLRVDADGAPVEVRGKSSSVFRKHAFAIGRAVN